MAKTKKKPADPAKAAANKKQADNQRAAEKATAAKAQKAVLSSKVLQQPLDLDNDPKARAFMQAAVRRLGTYWEAYVPDVDADVRYYALQPEQIVTLRQRMAHLEITSVDTIKLPKRPTKESGRAERAEYKAVRTLLAHIQRCCARHPHDKPGPNVKTPPGALLWPGTEGLETVLKQDANRLVNTARRIAEFNHVYDHEPELLPGL